MADDAVSDEYQNHLRAQGVPDEEVEQSLADIEDILGFLTGLGVGPEDAGKAEVEEYGQQLIASGRNTHETFAHLRDYTAWARHRRLYVALLEALDCQDALEVLADIIESGHGRDVRDRVFQEPLPVPWTDEAARCTHAQTITTRMTDHLPPAEARAAWFKVQHGIPASHWFVSDAADRETFLGSDGIDDFLDKKRAERDAMLKRLHDEDELWYTVRITDEVLEYALADPELEVGRREGDDVFVSKIPYNAVEYLKATDPTMKRYYTCHCPLMRDAIRRGDAISPEVCDCSLGYASHYLAGLGMDIKGEVLESAVKGDTRCRFVFHLPRSL